MNIRFAKLTLATLISASIGLSPLTVMAADPAPVGAPASAPAAVPATPATPAAQPEKAAKKASKKSKKDKKAEKKAMKKSNKKAKPAQEPVAPQQESAPRDCTTNLGGRIPQGLRALGCPAPFACWVHRCEPAATLPPLLSSSRQAEAR